MAAVGWTTTRAVLTATCVALVAAGCGSANEGQGSARAAGGTRADCAVPPQSRSDGAADRRYQRVVDKLDARIESRFGVPSKEEPDAQLSRGLIGMAVESRGHSVTVVVDPRVVRMPAVRRDLERVVAQEESADRSGAPIEVRVMRSCNPAKRLLHAASVIRARKWSVSARASTFTSTLNPTTSQFDMVFDSNSRAAGRSLERRFPELVNVSFGEVSRSTRSNDSQPHWGGAGIGVAGDHPNICSSGFTVDTQSAGKAMVTAGHCFANGQRVESGIRSYGTAQGEYNYPVYDMMLINASTQNYDDDIYHDPIRSELSPIDVAGSQGPSIGTNLCISGMVHKAVCGNVVRSLAAELCDQDGCTTGLIRTERTGTDPCSGGTSGGAMYTATASSARVSGLLIGTDGASCLGENVANVRAHLAVAVATSP